jgi:hypothetical protein
MRWFVGCIVGLIGCGGDGEPHPDGVRSGSRLRAVFIAAADGERQFQTFHDRELGVDCWFQGDPPRCLPDVASTSLFRDAACSEPLLQVTPSTDVCTTLPDWIGVVDPDGCGGFTRIFARGPETALEVLFYVNPTTGECVSAPASQAFDYHAAGDELPLYGFVAGELRLEGDARIQREVIAGTDGSRRPTGLRDRELDSRCWYELDTCVPEFIWQAYSSDDLCSEPIGGWSDPACYPTPVFVGRYLAGDDDVFRPALQERGPSVTPAVLYTGTELACDPIEPNDGTTYYLPGAELGLDRLAALELVFAGEGRLQGVYLVSDDGLRHFDGSFYDHDLGAPCWPARVDDDHWRCLPSLPWVSTYLFADPACLQPIEVIDIAAGEPLVAAPESVQDGCDWITRLRAIGDELAPGSIYRLDGTCTAETWDTALVRRYEPGAEVPFDDYVELTLVTE